MNHLNIEIKAKSAQHDWIRKILGSNDAVFRGLDHQIDTYFQVQKGRLKLREGTIENCLIYYERDEIEGPKQSEIILFEYNRQPGLKEILTRMHGVMTVVDKQREIYFIGNIKFHLDDVKRLGTFVEIEAIDKEGKIGKERLLQQCTYYLDLFKIKKEDLISCSYSDLLSR